MGASKRPSVAQSPAWLDGDTRASPRSPLEQSRYAMAGAVALCSIRHTRGAKVKSGCRTCKIRKVKCDEDRPACRRCVSTGRNCDGYGIWGGGSNFNSLRLRRQGSNGIGTVVQPLSPVPILPSGIGEREYFEWFRCRTSRKMPGTFLSSFWDALLLQASLSEPAVLHAVLALSSIHKEGSMSADGRLRAKEIPDSQRQFSLQHYVSAISHLQPHFQTKDRASVRIALITCVVFISFDLLRGHFNAARMHLQNGLNVLRETQFTGNGILRVKPGCAVADDSIIEAFSRLNLQVELFKHDYQGSYLALQVIRPETQASSFHSVKEAWQHMERVFNQIFYLTHQVRQQVVSGCKYPQPSLPMLDHQRDIRRELARWSDMYEASKDVLKDRTPGRERKRFYALYPYHTIATIMADTCLQASDELAYDSHTDQFVLLVRQLANMWAISSPSCPAQGLPGRLVDMSRTIIDMGWIPPLYYVAIKCRIHRIRLQAIRLLETTSHREGFWDAETAACVARKVMEMEERGSYKDMDTADDFQPLGFPHPEDLLEPAVPLSYRLREVETVLSGDPIDRILLFCKQRVVGIDQRVQISEYDVHSHRWTDAGMGY